MRRDFATADQSAGNTAALNARHACLAPGVKGTLGWPSFLAPAPFQKAARASRGTAGASFRLALTYPNPLVFFCAAQSFLTVLPRYSGLLRFQVGDSFVPIVSRGLFIGFLSPGNVPTVPVSVQKLFPQMFFVPKSRVQVLFPQVSRG